MGYWTNLDTLRPTKKEGLILDLGKRVKPFITPDDPDGWKQSSLNARDSVLPARRSRRQYSDGES
jgi:hypothetical protein